MVADRDCLIATDPKVSAWVSASAGTGKTKILVDRVLRLLLAGRRNILCLTFTNAAAAEMLERVEEILSSWMVMTDAQLCADLNNLTGSPVSQFMRAQTLFVDLPKLNLNIQTIHAFCYRLISTFPLESGVPINAKLQNCQRLYSSIFNKMFEDPDSKSSLAEVAIYLNFDLSDLFSELLKHDCHVQMEETVYQKLGVSLKDPYPELPDAKIEDLQIAAQCLRVGSVRDQKLGMAIDRWCAVAPEKRCQETKWYTKLWVTAETEEKKLLTSLVTKKTMQTFPHLESILIAEQDSIFNYIRRLSASKIANRTAALLRLFVKFKSLYDYEKYIRGIIDYDDVINFALKLLSDRENSDWVLFYLDQKIDHILIDEAQDNNLKQWQIIEKLSADFFVGDSQNGETRTIFVVGDVKQSIYGFQGSESEYFHLMRQVYANKIADNQFFQIQLQKSFRSLPPILNLVDTVFQNLSEEISLIAEPIIHNPCRQSEAGVVEIWPICEVQSPDQGWIIDCEGDGFFDAEFLLAKRIVTKICGWLDIERPLLARDRPILPEDVMILVRHRTAIIDYLTQEFEKLNIAVAGQSNFIDHLVVKDFINLGEFLLLPTDDLALAGVLKSPLFSFSEDDLFLLAYDRGEESLWSRLQFLFPQHAEFLLKLIKISRERSVLEFYTILWRDEAEKFIIRLGHEVSAVMDDFMCLLMHNRELSLQAFLFNIKLGLFELDKQSKKSGVRITTVHGAKGLQSPIVFLLDTTTVPQISRELIFNDEDIPLWVKGEKQSYCDEIKRQMKYKEYSEYLRLLYVALTRAEDELYITGSGKVQKGSWYQLITSFVKN